MHKPIKKSFFGFPEKHIDYIIAEFLDIKEILLANDYKTSKWYFELIAPAPEEINNLLATYISKTFFKKCNITELLVKNGADVNLRFGFGGWTLLIWAMFNSTELLTCVLGLGADPNICDHMGYSPLYYQCLLGRNDTMRMLIERGANINRITALGGTLLADLIMRKNLDMVKYYCQHFTVTGEPIECNLKLKQGTSLHPSENIDIQEISPIALADSVEWVNDEKKTEVRELLVATIKMLGLK